MRSLVPIVGHESYIGTPLKKRVERLLRERGFAAMWIDDVTFEELISFSPLDTWIPLTISISQSDGWEEHSDIVMPILETFPSTQLILSNADFLAKQIYELPSEISLWGKKAPTQLVRKAMEYIYLYLHDTDMSVADICKAVILTDDTLEKKFENWNGQSIWKFVVYARLREGCRILLETKIPISEISICIGYGDLTSFDRAFKKNYKITPSAFRKNAKNFRQNLK